MNMNGPPDLIVDLAHLGGLADPGRQLALVRPECLARPARLEGRPGPADQDHLSGQDLCRMPREKAPGRRRVPERYSCEAHESSTSGGYLGIQCLQRFQSLDATRNWDYRYPAQRTALPVNR